MGRFRKKPVEIEAVRIPDLFEIDDRRAVEQFLGKQADSCRWSQDGLMIRTLEGDMYGAPGDMLIRGVKGELYPCKADIFAATYEPAEAPARTWLDGDERRNGASK